MTLDIQSDRQPASIEAFRPALRATRAMLFTAGALVTIIGISLFVLTDQTERFFAWTIDSLLTAAFLGGSYWAAAVVEFLSSRERLWAYARPSFPGVAVFTFLTLVVTLIHIENFHFDTPLFITRLGTWVWLAVYAFVPIALTILFIMQLRQPGIDPPRDYRLPGWVRVALTGMALFFILVGAALLVAPLSVAPYWPWPLTALTGRAIGAWWAGIGVIAGQAAWENDWLRLRAVTASFLAFALLQSLTLLRYGTEFDWGSVAGWLYLLTLLLVGVIGAVGVVKSRGIPGDERASL